MSTRKKLKGRVFNADELGKLGFGIVLYANAALQGAVMGMQKALAGAAKRLKTRTLDGAATHRSNKVASPILRRIHNLCAIGISCELGRFNIHGVNFHDQIHDSCLDWRNARPVRAAFTGCGPGRMSRRQNAEYLVRRV